MEIYSFETFIYYSSFEDDGDQFTYLNHYYLTLET